MTNEEKIEALRNTLSSIGWAEVIRPALDTAVANAENQWINGIRAPGDEKITDEVLKGRIWALCWMRGWDSRLNTLVLNMDAQEKQRAQTVDFGEGGSPY